MSAKMWVEIVCHDCARVANNGRFVRGGRIPVREMTKGVVKDGWRQRTSGDYECPACTKAGLARLHAITHGVYATHPPAGTAQGEG